MSRRRRRPAEPPHHPGKQLTLNEIKFSSCESLKFPYDLACEFCKPKLCIHSNTRQPKNPSARRPIATDVIRFGTKDGPKELTELRGKLKNTLQLGII